MNINEMVENVEREVRKLKNCGDSVGIKIKNDFGFFIEVEEHDNGKEYFIEPNTVDEDDCFEPIGDNFGVSFGDFQELRKAITNYLNKLTI